MYGIVMHDYMRDYLSQEFVIVYGNTKTDAIANAWEKLMEDMKDDIKQLQLDHDNKNVTKKSFVKAIIDNENSDDGLYFSYPFSLYVKMFEIPDQIK